MHFANFQRKAKLRMKRAMVELTAITAPPVSVKRPHYPVELHVVTSHAVIPLLLISVKQLLRHLKMTIPVVLHDDGSLTKNDCKLLAFHIRGVQILRYENARRRLNSLFNSGRRFPNCAALVRSVHGTSRLSEIRIVHIPLLTTASKILLMDADFLWFGHPKFISDWIKNSTDRSMFYMKDQKSYYALTHKDLSTICKTEVIPRVNCGLLGLMTDGLGIEKIELRLAAVFHFFKKNLVSKHNRIFLDQDNFAMYLSMHKHNVTVLPDTYFLYARYAWNNERLPHDKICIHFSGPFKDEWYNQSFLLLFPSLNKQK